MTGGRPISGNLQIMDFMGLLNQPASRSNRSEYLTDMDDVWFLARCFAAFNLYEEKKRKNNSHLDISTTVPQFQDPEHILTFPLHVLPSPHAEISQESLERRVLPRPCRWRRFRRKWGNFSMEISSIRRSIYIYTYIYIFIYIYREIDKISVCVFMYVICMYIWMVLDMIMSTVLDPAAWSCLHVLPWETERRMELLVGSREGFPALVECTLAIWRFPFMVVFNGKSYSNGRFGGTPILGKHYLENPKIIIGWWMKR